MVDADVVRTLQDEYPWGSWAIWDPAFPDDCVEQEPARLSSFILDQHERLTPNVVLIGLNRSDDLDAPFANFHSPSGRHYDGRLKEFIQDGGLDGIHGAYMTDLVDDVDPDSNRVVVNDADIEALLGQLQLLDRTEYHVVCFGNKPFDGLLDYFDLDDRAMRPEIRSASTEIDGFTLHFYRVWFYGLYGIYQDKVEIFERQLRTLNDRFA